MAVPTDATLAWVADVAAPGGRLVDAGPLAAHEPVVGAHRIGRRPDDGCRARPDRR
jgi:hypothetical protein